MGLVFGQELSNKLLKNLLPYDLIGFIDNNFAEDLGDHK